MAPQSHPPSPEFVEFAVLEFLVPFYWPLIGLQ